MMYTVVKPNTYQDSVSLMVLSANLSKSDRVRKVSIMMGTPANKEIFTNTGFGTPEIEAAGPSDMVIVVDAEEEGEGDEALAFVTSEVEDFIKHQAEASSTRAYSTVASLGRALTTLPGANLALISIPGQYAAAEAHRMLDKGLHTMLFSDNVSVEEEIALKTKGAEKGLLVMGPDCGTSAFGGVPLAFSNVVRKGGIGIVGASGTGTQEVMVQIDRLGGGVSHAIGLGGRDLKEAVGGRTCLQALDALDADPATHVVVLVSKPPSASVRDVVLTRCQQLSKPVVAVLLGESPSTPRDGNITFAATLEETARLAVAVAPPTALVDGQRHIRGLFCGGTLASEAAMLLSEGLGIPSNAEHGAGYMVRYQGHEVIDLGDDVYTVGRPHPMIDPSLRTQMVTESFDDPDLAVLLLDIVTGYGSHPDPAGAVAPAIKEGLAKARAAGREVVVVASVCGTSGDPQVLETQEQSLREAGVVVLANNASAVRYALSVVHGKGRAESAAVSNPVARLLKEGPKVINVGLVGFADDLQSVGAPVVQYRWAPVAGGDKKMAGLLDLLS